MNDNGKLNRLKQVFRYLIDNSDLPNQNKLAEALDYNNSYLSQLVTEKVELTSNFFYRVHQKMPEYTISSEWVMTGKGSMLDGIKYNKFNAEEVDVIDSENSSNQIDKLIEQNGKLIDELQAQGRRLDVVLNLLKK